MSATMTAIAYVVEVGGRRIGTGAPRRVATDLARRLRDHQQRAGSRVPA